MNEVLLGVLIGFLISFVFIVIEQVIRERKVLKAMEKSEGSGNEKGRDSSGKGVY
jgi:MFS superfamily sulfate permease-like transporter